MFYVRNLTKTPITFQGILIPAYASADVEIISDYIGLSKLLNSGKATYGRKNKVVAEPAPEKKDSVEVAVEEKIEVPDEPISEPAVEAVESEVDDSQSVIPEIEEKKIVEKTSKKRRNSAKDDN
jgi:hypothetical protein